MKMDEEEAVATSLRVLKSMYGGLGVDDADFELVASRTVRWDKEKYARGSYSVMRVGTTPEDFKVLAQPITPPGRKHPTIFFAGEHTFVENHGTVRAAYLSGDRVAAEVLNALDANH